MKFISKGKLIQLLKQTKNNELSLKTIEQIFDKFADEYFFEDGKFALTKMGEEINPNVIYEIN